MSGVGNLHRTYPMVETLIWGAKGIFMASVFDDLHLTSTLMCSAKA